MSRLGRDRARYIRGILRQGPTEAGYAFFRARRRRRNVGDEQPQLLASDRLALSPRFAVAAEDLARNERTLAAYAAAGEHEVRSIQWFVPAFHLVWGGGVNTLLRFADFAARRHGVHNRFSVFDSDEAFAVERVRARIGGAFPALAGSAVTPASEPLGDCDLAIATAWESIWTLVRFGGARGKLVFVQDWEPDFYPAGSASAMLGQAARLGIPGIVNTPALADVYRAEGNPAVSFLPAVDVERFHPPPRPASPSGPVTIFFYGRPRTARNAFGLGLAALREVKRAYGERVRIVCAGESWSPGQYGAADVLENLGLLDRIERVAELYRGCDVGLVFMLSRHPSYQPLEFMASGMAVVTNQNDHTGWLLAHERNALLAPPLPALVAAQIGRLVEDPELRRRLADAGRETVSGVSWEEQFEAVWETVSGRRAFELPTGARRSAAPRG